MIDQLAAAKAKVALDTDAKLTASMAKAGNVLAPSIFTAAVATADTDLT